MSMTDAKLTFSVTENGIKMLAGNGTATQAEEFVVVTGRVANQHPNIVAKAMNGRFYTPMIVSRNGVLLSHANGNLYQGDGKKSVSLDSYNRILNKSEIRLPTLISNHSQQGSPTFYNLIAFGEDALRLANVTPGSTLTIAGRMQNFWFETEESRQSIQILRVDAMQTLIKKGVSHGQVQ